MALQLADARHALKHAEERAARALAAKASYKEQVGGSVLGLGLAGR